MMMNDDKCGAISGMLDSEIGELWENLPRCRLGTNLPQILFSNVEVLMWVNPAFHFEESLACNGPPLWSSGQSSWLQIQRYGFDSQRYQIFWDIMGSKRDPLSLVSTTEELLGRKSSGSGLESREYSSREPSRWPRGTLYPQKLALTSPTSGISSARIVRSRTQATEFSLI
jgi:hypothetical protein